MKTWSWLTQLIEPARKLIDDIHTSDEERLMYKAELNKIEYNFAEKLLEYEKQLLAAKSSIIVAEANGSWLQRSWRPITMLTFLALVVFDAFGWLAFRLSDQAWVLLQLGLAGYVVGRSGEKMLKSFKNGKGVNHG